MTKIDKRALSSKLTKELGEDHALTKTAVKAEGRIADLSAEVEDLTLCLEKIRQVTRNNGNIQKLIRDLIGIEQPQAEPDEE